MSKIKDIYQGLEMITAGLAAALLVIFGFAVAFGPLLFWLHGRQREQRHRMATESDYFPRWRDDGIEKLVVFLIFVACLFIGWPIVEAYEAVY